jgi:hypothetical protein
VNVPGVSHAEMEIESGMQTEWVFTMATVTSGAHGFDDGWVGVIQIDEDVARITIRRGTPSTSPSSSPLDPWR